MRRASNLPPGFVNGRVVDESGAPLADATVSVYAYRGADHHDVVAQCGADGRFRIGPLAAQAAAKLYLDSPAHGRERVEGVVVFPGVDHELGDLVVPRGLVASGRVVDEAGRPIAGATVTVLPFHSIFEGTIEGFGGKLSLVTSEEGCFATPRLAASLILLEVTAPGRVHADEHVEWPGTGLAHDLGTIELGPETPLRGRVVSASGAPIAGASVTADIDHTHRVKTADDGTFVIEGQSATPRHLQVRAAGFVEERSLRIEDPTRVVVVLASASQVTGTVVDDASGAPLRPKTVGLGIVPRDRPDMIQLVENGSEIADDGSFRVWYEDAGRCVVTVTADRYSPAHVDVGELARPRARFGVVVRMKRSSEAAPPPRDAIHGRVLGLTGDPRDALASLWHSIPPRGTWRQVVRGVTLPCWVMPGTVAPLAADGSFQFDDEDVGRRPFAVRIDRSGAAPLAFGPFTLAAGETRELALERTDAALLSGRLVHAPDGFTARWWVVVSSAAGVTLSAAAVRDGRFSLVVPAGRHALRAGTDALRSRTVPERPDGWRAEPGSEALAEYLREAAALIAPLLEVDLAPGERRDVGEVRLPDFLPDA